MIPLDNIVRFISLTFAAIIGENLRCFALMGSPGSVLIRTMQFGISPTGSSGVVTNRLLTACRIFVTISWDCDVRCDRSSSVNMLENIFALSSSD